jgi:hypothetical protein
MYYQYRIEIESSSIAKCKHLEIDELQMLKPVSGASRLHFPASPQPPLDQLFPMNVPHLQFLQINLFQLLL